MNVNRQNIPEDSSVHFANTLDFGAGLFHVDLSGILSLCFWVIKCPLLGVDEVSPSVLICSHVKGQHTS